MPFNRTLVHTIVLFLAPVIVAAYGWSVPAAVLLIILLLVWRWLIVMSQLVMPARRPALELETISASHFVEKVRWNMDVAGIEYTERPAGGTLGAFYLGRTVPRLNFRTGAVRSQIGNSPEILRYLWGAYGSKLGERAAHLEPTDERIDFEKRLDRYGANLQVWVYHHLLTDRALTLKAWGADSPDVPGWQRWLLKLLFPVQASLIRRSFRITPDHVDKSRHHIDELLADVDLKLADGRESILGGDALNYTDYAFAALSGLWVQPENYGGGRADAVRIKYDQAPPGMRADIDKWSEDHPRVVRWIEALYENRGGPAT